MDVLKLRQLAIIIKYGSFAGAADALGISQPALSKSIRSLEQGLGVQLLERGRFGALPTQFGLALARHADAVDAELRTAAETIASLKSAKTGHLRIGCGPSEATRLLPMALRRIGLQSPGIKVTVLYGLNEALTPMVKHGEVDFALSSISTQSTDPDIKQIPLHEDSAAVIARPMHPLLAQRKPLHAQQLLDQQWVLARHHELERRALDDLFHQSALQPPEATIETTSAVLMKSVVMQSDFLTFLPRELIFWEERAGQLRALKLIAPSWRRVVGVTMRARSAPSPSADAMINELKRAASEFT
ncbi:MAG: LysR family transcriptional regulator [Gammaproteobacteria bacterium]